MNACTKGLVAELVRVVSEGRTWAPIWTVWLHVVSTTLRHLVPDLTPQQSFDVLRRALPKSLCFELSRRRDEYVAITKVAFMDVYDGPGASPVDVVAARAFEAAVVPNAADEEAFHAQVLLQLQATSK